MATTKQIKSNQSYVRELKKTRCPGCYEGLIHGPYGGITRYWKHSVVWAIVDGRYCGVCDCGACYSTSQTYRKLRQLSE